MNIVAEGTAPLFMNPDPDPAREHFRKKNKSLADKRMSVKDAVAKFIHDGDYLAVGGFGGVRIPSAAVHEIVRQKKKNLGFFGHCSTHDFQIISAGECIDRCDISYVIGLEARGVSANARKFMESGKVKTTEWTNAGLTWRIKAAALGVPFLIGRQSLGADSFPHSASKIIECPYTGKKFATFPAVYPDVAVIHVNEADRFGNAAIKGVSIIDEDLARAAKHLIITCERLIDTEVFRSDPHTIMIPYFCVDAVCEVPYGSYPGNMPFEYFSDEAHIKEWLAVEKDPAQFKEFLDRNIFSCADFNEYLEKNGGLEKMQELRRKEFMLD